ncbi:hypothetical protein J7M00_01665 [bacterium]|nr:hypothetical protein [bacterium]
MSDETYEWKCLRCGMVITTTFSYPPDKKAGGPCPKDSRGEHSWHRRN